MRGVCATCRYFFVQDSKAFPDTDGVCRRHAPRGPAIPAGSGWSVFPPMMAGHWCGEHQAIPLAAMGKRMREMTALVEARKAAA